jgi:ketosteroid isomerase-like protein
VSRENVELIRSAFLDASDGGRLNVLDPHVLEEVFQSFDPEIEVREDPRFPEAGVYRGLEALRAYISQFTKQFDTFVFEFDDVLDVDVDRVLLLFHIHGRGKDSGAVFDEDPAWIYKIRDRKVTRIEAYLDRREALDAVGLTASRDARGPGRSQPD